MQARRSPGNREWFLRAVALAWSALCLPNCSKGPVFEAPHHNGTGRRVILPSLRSFLDSGQSWRHCSLALQIEGDAMETLKESHLNLSDAPPPTRGNRT